jgi:hypothetical protein
LDAGNIFTLIVAVAGSATVAQIIAWIRGRKGDKTSRERDRSQEALNWADMISKVTSLESRMSSLEREKNTLRRALDSVLAVLTPEQRRQVGPDVDHLINDKDQ